MKKKGLIVATIVMVLVLAVSLTTATYAWFTTTAQTTIDSIAIKAASGTDIKIGMSRNNGYNATPNADHFVSGGLTIQSRSGDTCEWTGDAGLGVELTTGLTLNAIDKATGYGTPYVAPTYQLIPNATTAQNISPNYYFDGEDYIPCPVVDVPGDATEFYTRTSEGTVGVANTLDLTQTLEGGQIVKASGQEGNDSYDPKSVAAAVINTDYLHFTIGLAPSIENVNSIALNMFVNPTGSKTTLGVEAALYFYYRVNNEVWVKQQVYTQSQSTLKTSINSGSTIGTVLNNHYHVDTYEAGTTLNAGYAFIPIVVNATDTSFAVDEITQIEFYIFYDGTDPDCVNAALGSECEVLFYITNTTVGA